ALPRPIPPQQADALSPLYREVGVFQQRMTTEGDGDAAHAQQRHASPPGAAAMAVKTVRRAERRIATSPTIPGSYRTRAPTTTAPCSATTAPCSAIGALASTAGRGRLQALVRAHG